MKQFLIPFISHVLLWKLQCSVPLKNISIYVVVGLFILYHSLFHNNFKRFSMCVLLFKAFIIFISNKITLFFLPINKNRVDVRRQSKSFALNSQQKLTPSISNIGYLNENKAPNRNKFQQPKCHLNLNPFSLSSLSNTHLEKKKTVLENSNLRSPSPVPFEWGTVSPGTCPSPSIHPHKHPLPDPSIRAFTCAGPSISIGPDSRKPRMTNGLGASRQSAAFRTVRDPGTNI